MFKKLCILVLTSFLLICALPTNVLAEENNEQLYEEIMLPDTFTYFENGTLWEVSNANDLKNIKVEILYKSSLRHGTNCLPGNPEYPTCDGDYYNGNLGGVVKESIIRDFVICVFKKSIEDLGLDILSNATLKGLELIFKKFGKEAVAKKIASAIPGLNVAYWIGVASKTVHACVLNL